jgi:phenylpropionate dioxygenase-like ring-hydroxylating dioxygenase large terminal subunit
MRAMPSDIYTSTKVLANEQERLFRSKWICVGRASAIAEAGAYLTCEIAGQPIVVRHAEDAAGRGQCRGSA